MKKGFTLIEVLIALSITVLLVAAGFQSIEQYKKVYDEINDVKACEINIMSFINNAKQYCREKNKPGYVLFDIGLNSIDFYSEGKRLESFTLPEGLYLVEAGMNLSRIEIKRNGTTSSAGTIAIRDKNGERYKITVRVGTGYVEIK